MEFLVLIGVVATIIFIARDLGKIAGGRQSGAGSGNRAAPEAQPPPPDMAGPVGGAVPGLIQGFADAGGPGVVNGLFVIVTSPNAQTQLMAMSLASQVVAKGKSVRILLCGPGGDLALESGQEIVLKPINKSPRMLLRALIQNGVKVEICPFYLANREPPAPALIEGITQAAPPQVADGLLEPGIKLFTF